MVFLAVYLETNLKKGSQKKAAREVVFFRITGVMIWFRSLIQHGAWQPKRLAAGSGGDLWMRVSEI